MKLVPHLHLQVNIVLSLCRKRCESVNCRHYKANTLNNTINMCGLVSYHTQVYVVLYFVDTYTLASCLVPRSLGTSLVIHGDESMHCRRKF